MGVRLLLGLGLPLAFAAATLATAWVVFAGPGLPWGVILFLLCLVIGGVIAVAFWGVLFDGDFYELGSFAAGIAGAAFVIAALIGADQWLLHERGHDIACRVTAITEKSNGDSTWFEYGLACDGGQPTKIVNSSRYGDIEKGGRIVVRYDPAGNTVPVLAREASDGITAFKFAAFALGVLLLVGLISALAY